MGELDGVVLVGADAAPCEVFSILEKRHGCRAFLGKGKTLSPTDELTEAVESARLVLIGLSVPAKRAEAELHAARVAIENGVHFGFYADAPGAAMRPWFEHAIFASDFLAVLNEHDRKVAHSVFPPVDVKATGNPAWDKYWFPKVGRKEARAKLGLKDSQMFLYVSGNKVTAISVPAVSAVHQAVVTIPEADWRVLVGIHPSDPCPLDAYQEFTTYSAKNKSGEPIVGIVDRDVADEEACVQAADMILGTASTAEVAGGICRIPTFAFLTELSLNRNPIVTGQREWFWGEVGVSIVVRGESSWLAAELRRVFTPGGFDAIRRRMEEVFVKPERPGVALEKLEQLVAKHLQ